MKRMYLFTIGVMLLVTSCGHKKEGDATLIRPVKTASASSQSVIRKDFSGTRLRRNADPGGHTLFLPSHSRKMEQLFLPDKLSGTYTSDARRQRNKYFTYYRRRTEHTSI